MSKRPQKSNLAKQAARVALVDELTILTCADGKFATKQFKPDGKGGVAKIAYDAGWKFSVRRAPVASLQDLSKVLQGLEDESNAFVIRGAPVPGQVHPRVRRTKANFQTPVAGRRWVLIDFDKTPLPDGLALDKDVLAVVDHLVSLLPEEFHDCSYHFQLSSSAGMGDPGVVSAHLWFWLSEPWTDAALKAWAKTVNSRAKCKLIDTALFNDVQPHFTAAPIFHDGVANPFPVRSGLVKKSADAVSIRPLAAPERPASSAPHADFQPGPGFEGWLARIGDHVGGEGLHDPIIRAIASYVAEHGKEGTNVEELFQAVRERVLEADHSQHDDAYVGQMASREHIMPAIEGALEKWGDRPAARRKSRLVPDVAAPQRESELSADEAQSRLDEVLNGILDRTDACVST